MATESAQTERVRIGGILRWRNLTRLGVMSVPDRPGVAAAILRRLGEQGINVQFVVQCIDLNQHTHVIFCVAGGDAVEAMAVLQDLKGELPATAIIEEPGMAIVSVFGPDFRERPGIAGMVFGALASAGINILAISTSISTVSCVIHEDHLETAVQALESTFVVP